ncbi:MAG: hypothetical protein GY832_33955 [Chloroflexi bacterium]|nr:hypothetical protein [Chloroflexota bacterium]
MTIVCTDVQSVSITGLTTALSGTANTKQEHLMPFIASGVLNKVRSARFSASWRR